MAPKIALMFALALAASSCGSLPFGGEEEATSETAVAETSTTEATTTTTASPVDVDLYCQLTIANDDKADVFFAGDGPSDPVQFEAFLLEMQDGIVEAMEVADPSIKADLALSKEEIDEFYKIAAEYEFELLAAVDALDDASENPAWDAAGDALNAYEEEVCGIDSDEVIETDEQSSGSMESAGDTDSSSAITLEEAELAVSLMQTQAGLDLVVEGFQSQAPNVSAEQAECFMKDLTAEQFMSFAELGEADVELDFDDPAVVEVFERLEVCDISLSDLLG